jgi:peptide/nickel transport system substrate-binding protein
MAALVAGWQEAGFAPEVTAIGDDYFRSIATPQAATAYDVYCSTWAPTWASASTVLPPLFDPGLNLTSAGTGRDVGSWSDAAWTGSLAAISSTADPNAREKAWAAADDRLLAAGAYVGLAERYAAHLAGSGVRNLAAQPHSGGMVDLAVLGVAQ